VIATRANCGGDEAFRDGDRAPAMMRPVVEKVRDWLCFGAGLLGWQIGRCETGAGTSNRGREMMREKTGWRAVVSGGVCGD